MSKSTLITQQGFSQHRTTLPTEDTEVIAAILKKNGIWHHVEPYIDTKTRLAINWWSVLTIESKHHICKKRDPNEEEVVRLYEQYH